MNTLDIKELLEIISILDKLQIQTDNRLSIEQKEFVKSFIDLVKEIGKQSI